MDYLPSQKFTITLVAAAVFIVAWVFVVGRDEVEKSPLVYLRPEASIPASSAGTLQTFVEYTVADLAIASTSPRDYGLALAKALAPLGGKRPDEAALAAEAVTGKDLAKAQENIRLLAESVGKWDKAFEAALLLPVPENAAKLHIALVNLLERMTDEAGTMAQALEQPGSQRGQRVDLVCVAHVQGQRQGGSALGRGTALHGEAHDPAGGRGQHRPAIQEFQ